MIETENTTPATPAAGSEPAGGHPAKKSAPRAKRRRRRSIKAQARLAQRKAVDPPKLRRLVSQDDRLVDARPHLPPLDPLAAAQEEARHAKEGNLKLARAVEILREGLELLVVAEIDRQTGVPVDAHTLRSLAAACLDRYSTHVGQNWRTAKNKLTGATLAGTKGNRPVHESQMGAPPAQED